MDVTSFPFAKLDPLLHVKHSGTTFMPHLRVNIVCYKVYGPQVAWKLGQNRALTTLKLQHTWMVIIAKHGVWLVMWLCCPKSHDKSHKSKWGVKANWFLCTAAPDSVCTSFSKSLPGSPYWVCEYLWVFFSFIYKVKKGGPGTNDYIQVFLVLLDG